MKNFFRIFFFCLCFCMALTSFESCSGKKVYSSEIEVIDNGRCSGPYKYVNYRGKAYTGKVWANDESGYQNFENGILTGGVIFHKNGKNAVVFKVENNDDFSFEFYDESGNKIDNDEFYNNYFHLFESFFKLPIK